MNCKIDCYLFGQVFTFSHDIIQRPQEGAKQKIYMIDYIARSRKKENKDEVGDL